MSAGQVVFRADASPVIGGGHIVRCLALADALAAAGWRCTFAVGPETLKTIPALAASGHERLTVNHVGENTPASLARRFPDGVELLVVDHYGCGDAFESACRTWARRILAIDDLADRAHDCDLLLDQTLGRREDEYRSMVPAACQLLLGPKFALLRPQFAAGRRLSAGSQGRTGPLRRVLVSLGASDPCGLSAVAARGLQATGLDIEIDIVLAPDEPRRGALEDLAAASAVRIDLHAGVSDMAALMVRSDLAIGAAGVSSWERCCLGLASLVVVTAENQVGIAAALERAGAIRLLGRGDSVTSEIVAEAVLALANNADSRAQMSARAAAICDGLGAKRVQEALAA